MNLDLIRIRVISEISSDNVDKTSPFLQEYEIAHGIASWPAAQPRLSVLSTAALSLSFHRSSLQSSGRRIAIRKNTCTQLRIRITLMWVMIQLFT
jgi:hypothetical protein